MRVKPTRIPVMRAVRDMAGLARKPYFDGDRLLALTVSEDATKPASLTRQPRSSPLSTPGGEWKGGGEGKGLALLQI